MQKEALRLRQRRRIGPTSAKVTCDRVRFPRSRISRGAAPVNSRDHVVGDGVLAEVGGENGHCPPDQ
jgi:hypothetical protein